MIRTVWLAAFCLACLGGLYASKVTASISAPEDGIADPATSTAAAELDTLTAADKVDMTGLRPAAEATLVQSTDLVVVRPVKANRFALHRLPRPNDMKAKVIVVLPRPRPKLRLSKNGKSPSLAGDLKKCSETNSLAALIMSLTGAPHCG